MRLDNVTRSDERSLRALVRDDSGVVLFVVLAAIALITIVAAGAYAVSSQSLQESVHVERQTQAFQAANSGVDIALARIAANGFVTADFPATGTAADGSTYVTNVNASTNAEYICTSVGTDPHGNTETITVRFFYLNLWNMNIASGAGDALGGGSVKGTTSVYGPFYVRGGVELASNSTVERGPFFIKGGDLKVSGSGTLGNLAPIDLYVTGQVNGKPANINVRTQSNSVPDIVLPPVDAAYLAEKFSIATAESIDNVKGSAENAPSNTEYSNGYTGTPAPGASAFYKAISAGSEPSAVGLGARALTIGGTGSWGNAGDDFVYNDSTNVLTVEGTVFIDGPLTIADDVLYQGNGTIVCNGPITIERSWRPNRPANNYYMNATNAVGLVTPTDIRVLDKSNNLGKDPDGVPDLCGAFFASKDFSMAGNLLVKGSVLAGSISFTHANEHLVTDPNLPGFLPKSMPGAGQYILTKGAWVR